MGCRVLLTNGFSDRQGRAAVMYHGSPWAHLRLDPDSGQFQERGGVPDRSIPLRPGRQGLPLQELRDDFIVQMAVAAQHGVFARPEEVSKLCRLLNVRGRPFQTETIVGGSLPSCAARRLSDRACSSSTWRPITAADTTRS